MKQISFTFLPSQAEILLLGLFGCPDVLQPGPSRAGPERLVTWACRQESGQDERMQKGSPEPGPRETPELAVSREPGSHRVGLA